MSTATANKLKTKDIITVVLLALINVVIFFASSVLYATPITIILMPVFFALLEGIVYFIIGTKVKKPGAILIYSIVRAIMGGYLPYIILFILSGFIAELLLWKMGYGNAKALTISYIINQVLAGDADIIIIDPEREYSPLVRALGGEIINISATSPTHINAMDMNREYGDGANPVILKSEFIMSLCEQLIGGTNLGAKQKSIIDRCTASVYRDYQQRGYTGTVPTLQDFRAELLKQDEPEAKEIALAIELFTHGSLNTFAKPTNVDTDNRLICYDILDLGKQLMPIGMLVVLDSILNRITQNRAKGKQTFIFIDEIYLLFQHEYSANFLFTLWKRVRKYGAYATGITQNVDVRPDRALCKAV